MRDIIYYIADDSASINVVLKYLDKIEESINGLKEFPNSGSIPRYSILKNQSYRLVIVEKHIIFYKVNEERTEEMEGEKSGRIRS